MLSLKYILFCGIYKILNHSDVIDIPYYPLLFDFTTYVYRPILYFSENLKTIF